jgi:hypothetical protein
MTVKKQKRKQTIWVIMHYEIIGPDSPHPDAMQFHVSSSLKKAEKYIRTQYADSHCWWQVHPHVLDTKGDEGAEVYYYSHRGTPKKSPPPSSRVVALFRKHVARYPERFSCCPDRWASLNID